MSGETKFLIASGFITLAIIIGGVFFYAGKGTDTKKTVESSVLVKQNSNIYGNASASATLVEFGDFQCPACAQAQSTVTKLREEKKDSVYFVFRHFPLPQHKNALPAALAAEAAGEQGKFWEMGDMLYMKQTDWSEEANPEEKFLSYAKELKLDEEAFKKAYEGRKYEEKINSDAYDGNQAGVDATPTFYINGEKYTGNYSYDNLSKAIESGMKK